MTAMGPMALGFAAKGAMSHMLRSRNGKDAADATIFPFGPYIIHAAMTWTCAIMQSYYCTAKALQSPQVPTAKLTCLPTVRWIRLVLGVVDTGSQSMMSGDGSSSKRPGASWKYWNAMKNLLSKSDTTRSGSRCPSQIGGVASRIG